MARVSIGLPVYNGENYLRETIESLLGQTYEGLELVIADNASTDGTESICREFAATDPRVRYFRHDRNLGAAPNYNFTVEQSHGEYFMWNAHDDLRGDRFVEAALDMHKEHPTAASVISVTTRIDQHGKRIRRRRAPAGLLSDDIAERLHSTLIDRHPGVLIFGLMRREVLDATNRHGAFPGADRLLAVELALRGPFVEIPEDLFFMRDHPSRYVRMERGAEKDAWWDTARAAHFDAPALRRMRGYLAAIRNADMTSVERNRCLRALVRASGHNSVAIGRETARDFVLAGVARTRARFRRSS